MHSSLGIALAALGEKDLAVQEGIRATQLLPVSRDGVYSMLYIFDLALIYTILGEYDSALDKIEYLFSTPSPYSPAWLDLDPRWERLKKLPRYVRILQDFKK